MTPLTEPRPNPPQDVINLALLGAYGDANWANVFWIRNGARTVPSIDDLQYLGEQVGFAYNQRFLELQAEALTLEKYRILYYGPTGADVGTEGPLNHHGDVGITGFPANVAISISWAVQAHYRGGHPRTYLCGVNSQETSSPTTITPTYRAGIEVRANQFLQDVNFVSRGGLDDLHLGTVSFQHKKAWREPPVFRDFIEGAATVDSRIDSQRRRLGRDR